MTAFGKLLVFLNLLFSVVTGALIVVVFTTRANWKTAYVDAKAKAEQASAAYVAERTAHENDLKQKDSGSTSLAAEVASLKGALAELQTQLADAVDKRDKQLALYKNAQLDAERLQGEMKQINEERKTLGAQMQDLRKRLIDIQVEKDTEHGRAVNADLAAKNLIGKNLNLLKAYEDLMRKYQELEQSGLGGLGGGSAGGNSILNPPPKAAPPNVRGTVTFVSKENTGLAQISIGSDSGLSIGNVLTVFKGDEYKGDLTLTQVEPKTAVGNFKAARRSMKVEEKDSVITSFAGISNN